MTTYTPETRAQLKAAVVKAGMAPARAEQAVDVACHAADRAIDALIEVVRLAPDVGIGFTALELALQLASARMRTLNTHAHELGRASGVPYAASEVEVSRG